MRQQQFRRWQVLLGTILFLALMGLAGTSDINSNQAILDERINIRDHVQAAVEADANMWTAHYIKRAQADR